MTKLLTPPSFGAALSPLSTAGAVAQLVDHAGKDESRFGMGWSIDDTCGCVGTGEMALMWARSGSGKSTWYCNVVANTPEVPTVVVNMEMTARRQIEWLLPMTFDLETPAREVEEVLRSGEPGRYEEVMSALEQMPERYPNLHFVTPSHPTVADLEVLIEDIADQTGVKPLRMFIDHLGLMGDTADYQGYVKTAGALHALALSQDMAMIVLQQTGRSGGDAGRNDGHLPVTFSSGVFAGEQDADYVYGLWRPSRNPKFKKSRFDFPDPNDYYQMMDDYKKVEHLAMLQCIKNRPFGDLNEDGLELTYIPHSRRLVEAG